MPITLVRCLPDQLELGGKAVFLPMRYVQQDISHDVNLAALPGCTGEGALNRGNQAPAWPSEMMSDTPLKPRS